MSNSPLVDYTYISPHKTSPRVYPITKITIHHMAGNLTVEQCGKLFQTREACSNYGIGSDGRVGMYCEEKDRAWCSANYDNDNRAINIELANDGGAPYWHVSDKTLNKCIDLCVDVCKRNGIARLNYTGDKTGNLTQHNYFCATACPGPYLKTKFQYIADEVNARLEGGGTMLYKLKVGYASKGDVGTLRRLMDSLEVEYTEKDGYITTEYVNDYQKLRIEAKARELIVPCEVIEVVEPSDDKWKEKVEELEAKLQELKEEMNSMKASIRTATEILEKLS